MKRLSVLCTTMHRKDLSKYDEMKINTDVVFANQCDRDEVVEEMRDGNRVRMICTKTRGVGINRNITLLAADTEIVLFADDDMVYYDGYAEGVLKAFDELPQADMITFSIDFTKNGKVFGGRYNPVKRRREYNSLRYGACVLAARLDSLRRVNASFTTLFGGGCIYGSGEDSLFIVECIRKGLKLYSHSFVLGACSKDESTWFTGFHEKFFYDKGAWLAAAFPKQGLLMRHYFAMRFRKKTELSYRQCCRLIKSGQRGFKKLATWPPLRR